jgi:hypothetical protein
MLWLLLWCNVGAYDDDDDNVWVGARESKRQREHQFELATPETPRACHSLLKQKKRNYAEYPLPFNTTKDDDVAGINLSIHREQCLH